MHQAGSNRGRRRDHARQQRIGPEERVSTRGGMRQARGVDHHLCPLELPAQPDQLLLEQGRSKLRVKPFEISRARHQARRADHSHVDAPGSQRTTNGGTDEPAGSEQVHHSGLRAGHLNALSAPGRRWLCRPGSDRYRPRMAIAAIRADSGWD